MDLSRPLSTASARRLGWCALAGAVGAFAMHLGRQLTTPPGPALLTVLETVTLLVPAAVGGYGLHLLRRTSGRRLAMRPWRAAQTLADVGELTARWIERDPHVPQHPVYWGPADAETHTIAAPLAALNRGGLITIESQPQRCGTVQGRTRRQRAMVTGFAEDETMIALCAAAHAAGLLVFIEPGAPRRRRHTVDIATWGGRSEGAYQFPQTRRDLDEWAAWCPAAARLRDAWQIMVVDPDWGEPDRLWTALTAALD